MVVDTNVIAYYLLGTEPFREECGRFWRLVEVALAPASWEAEVANILWMAARTKVLGVVEALLKLDLAKALEIHSIPVPSLWHGALVRACSSGVAAYDTLFVELAERERLPLATFDQAVLAAFPETAKRPGQLLRPT
ncbi:MAG TPA: type II toxin-antitoxin system VapC family toxin [Thermoanaerobaculia bacterium]|nr:type II toxin-antitoxin system VapC family toxin [Thermoanaerobaculia bacterium]